LKSIEFSLYLFSMGQMAAEMVVNDCNG
jgi:hypothetical protein